MTNYTVFRENKKSLCLIKKMLMQFFEMPNRTI